MLHFSQEREEQVLALEGFMTVTIWAGVLLRSATAMNWFEVSQSQCDIAIELNSLARSLISKTWRFGQWRGGAVSGLVNDKKSDLLSPQSFTLQPPSVCARNKKGGSNFQWEICFADLLAFCHLIILGVMFQCMLVTSCNSNRTFSQVNASPFALLEGNFSRCLFYFRLLPLLPQQEDPTESCWRGQINLNKANIFNSCQEPWKRQANPNNKEDP